MTQSATEGITTSWVLLIVMSLNGVHGFHVRSLELSRRPNQTQLDGLTKRLGHLLLPTGGLSGNVDGIYFKHPKYTSEPGSKMHCLLAFIFYTKAHHGC
jgi:hypothetical protein